MTNNKIVVIAQIRPGKRADLERLLAKGPPYDLQAEGFEHHEVYVGETDVAFIFTAPSALSRIQRLAASPGGFLHVIKMTGLLSGARLLTQTFEWHRDHDASRTHV